MFLGITAEEIDKIYVEFLANIFSEEFPYNEQVNQIFKYWDWTNTFNVLDDWIQMGRKRRN